MKRTVHNLVQGTKAWHDFRASVHGSASEASAMLGISQYKSRDELIREKATGIKPEIDARTQQRFDEGHRLEELARPFAEAIIGDDLYPATVSIEIDGLILSASCDGWTMDEATAWEHKTLNAALQAALSQGVIPEEYHPQCEQVAMCTGADKVLFMASKGTKETELHAWYIPNPELRARITAGWKQLQIDVANYVPAEAEAPMAVAEPVASLPAINYQIDFSQGLSVHSNLDVFKAAALELVENSKVLLVSDQDFENAKARIKECEKAEKNIKSLIDRVLGELGDVNTFKADLEKIDGFIRQSRLNQSKQVTSRTAERKAEIINAGKAEAQAHTNQVNAKLGKVSLPHITVDFDAAVFRKSNFESMQSSVNDAVADFKIEANRWETHILMNLMTLGVVAKDHMFLFSDLQQLVLKDGEAMEAIAKQRIADHKAQEEARIQAEAKRIADEQIARDRKAEAQRIANERAESDRKAAEAARAAQQAAPQKEIPVLQPKQDLNAPTHFNNQADYDQFAVTSDFEQNFNRVFQGEERAPEVDAMVDLGDFQKGRSEGVVAGLELALAIYKKHGAAGFAKVVQDFIEIGVPEHLTKAA